jgi:hypothetical protein
MHSRGPESIRVRLRMNNAFHVRSSVLASFDQQQQQSSVAIVLSSSSSSLIDSLSSLSQPIIKASFQTILPPNTLDDIDTDFHSVQRPTRHSFYVTHGFARDPAHSFIPHSLYCHPLNDPASPVVCKSTRRSREDIKTH